ncbi:MAG: N-acetylneuraminate synthase family protein, partial [Myxococcota bacterium]
GLVFLSSPFSMEAVDLLERVGMPAWKVGSGEVTNVPFLQRLARTKSPVLLSSGMASFADLDLAAKTLREAGGDFALFQCTTSYPCPPERIGLNVLSQLRERYQVPVGLSDHSATIYAGLAAATLGASLLEVHVVLSRESFGPDVTSSVTTSELTELVRGVRFIETVLAHPIDKDRASEGMTELKTMFGKSVVAARDLEEGTTLTDADLALKKPATGIVAARYAEVVGRRLTRALRQDEQLLEKDLE